MHKENENEWGYSEKGKKIYAFLVIFSIVLFVGIIALSFLEGVEQPTKEYDSFLVLNNYGEKADIIELSTDSPFTIQRTSPYVQDRLPIENSEVQGYIEKGMLYLADNRKYTILPTLNIE